MAARPLSAPLQVFERTADVTVVLHESTLINVWRGTPTVAAFRRIDGYVEQTRRTGRFGVLVIIEPSQSVPPDSAARQENARITRKFENDCVGVATVLEGGSVKHTLIRFAIATMQLMSSSSVPQAIFDSVRDASMWFAKLSPATHSIETMLAVRHARALHEHRAGSLVWDSDKSDEPSATTDRRNAP